MISKPVKIKIKNTLWYYQEFGPDSVNPDEETAFRLYDGYSGDFIKEFSSYEAMKQWLLDQAEKENKKKIKFEAGKTYIAQELYSHGVRAMVVVWRSKDTLRIEEANGISERRIFVDDFNGEGACEFVESYPGYNAFYASCDTKSTVYQDKEELAEIQAFAIDEIEKCETPDQFKKVLAWLAKMAK